jgi:hypothetical protein
MTGRLPRGAWFAAAALSAVLILCAGRYGFHRDELYFIAAGRHPAWSYADQPPLVPLLAAAWYDVTGRLLWAFRLLPALAVGLVVLVAAATSRRLGGRARDQTAAAVLTAGCALIVAVGHLFSTTTFDILFTAILVLLLLKALQPTAGLSDWLVLGAVTAVALQVKTLPLFVLFSALVGLLIAGPRTPLRRPGPWLAAGLAGVGATPNLVWQAANGWPQLDVAAQIAAGSSITSAERPLVVPLQLVMVGPVVGVVLVVGLVALLRRPALRPFRWLAVAYLVLLSLIVITGGKPYYSGGLIPAILAAATPSVLDYVAGSRARRVGAGTLLAGHLAGTALIALPLAPPGSGPFALANAVNPDAGETLGWPRFAETVAGVVAGNSSSTAPSPDAVVTENYGEAGALDLVRQDHGPEAMPPVYSGHNAYGSWGPPPESARSVVLIGEFSAEDTSAWFADCGPEVQFDNGLGVDDEEQGVPIRVCIGPRRPWTQLWPQLRHLG